VPVYSYDALNDKNSRFRGTVEAASPRSVRRLLIARGLHPTRINEVTPMKAGVRLNLLKHLFLRLQSAFFGEKLISALENVTTMLSSGVALETAWATLSSHAAGASKFQHLLHELHEAVAHGRPFSEAMATNPIYFDRVDVALVRAGEDAGQLAESLQRLIERKRLGRRMLATSLGALTYPAFLVLVGCGVIIFLAGYVIPDLNAMIVAGGGKVPFLTQVLQIAAGALSMGLIPILLIGGLGSLFLLRKFPNARSKIALFIQRVPLIGTAWLNWQLAQFCLVLRMLLLSGVQLPAALLLASEAAGAGPLKRAAQQLHDRLLEGQNLEAPSEPGDSPLPDWLWQSLSVGQETGELEHVLEQVGKRFEAMAMRSAAKVGAILEPLMILVVGLFVGLVAYASLLPIIRLNTQW